MENKVTPELFKSLLLRFTESFQETPINNEKSQQLKNEVDLLDKKEIINTWVDLLRVQGPVEEVSENIYEIYDVNNFVGELNTSSNDYIHTIELFDNENTASVFMKFFFVFYCLNNGIKSSNYKISYNRK